MPFEENIDLRNYWQIIRKRKLLIILPFATVILIATVGSFLLTPVYQSSTTVLIGQIELLSRSVREIVPGIDVSRLSQDEREQRLATIKNQIISSGYLKRLIYELGLDKSANLVGLSAKTKEQFPEMSEQELKEKILIDILRKRIEVRFKGENLVEIVVYSDKPKLAAKMAEKLAQIFIEESLKYELFAVRGALDFSDEQLAIHKRKLQESEEKLRRYKQETLRSSVEDRVVSQDNINDVASVKDATKLKVKEADDETRFLKDKVQGVSHNPVLTYSQDFSDLKSDLLSQIRQYPEILIKYSWKDVRVVSLNQRVDDLLQRAEREISELASKQYPDVDQETLSQIKKYAYSEINLSFLKERLAVLDSSVNLLKDKLAKYPYHEQALRDLEEEVESNRSIYDKFLSQSQGSQISQQVQQAEAENKFRVIEPASIPLKPVRPNKLKIIMFGAMLGLGLGTGAVLLAEFIDHSFKKVEEAEEYLGLKVLGAVPKIDFLEKEFKKKTGK